MVDHYRPIIQQLFVHLFPLITTIVYGGGTNGLMGLIKEYADHQHIPIIGHNMDRWNPLPGEIIYNDLRSRQSGIIDGSDAYLVLPGGIGTLHEMIQVLCENDVQRLHKSVAIYDPDQIYHPLKELLTNMVEMKLLEHFPRCEWLSTVKEVEEWIQRIMK